ncbi:MAG: RnfABCDGE type electron transport complex subunit D, partial [Phycisphaerae bacterium]|nr:RnfABCDGE type electron transport complex subunit D [Phycisphaerae bacterium]
MAEENTEITSSPAGGPAKSGLNIHVAPAPHVVGGTLTTQRMMVDVLIGLALLVGWAVYIFRWYAVVQLGVCVLSCLAAEALLTAARRRPLSLGDGSAAVTGVILALSLPATAPWYVGVIGSFAAIALAKFIFGGLGGNIFNPAMVGRAFVMIAFPVLMGASAYIETTSPVQAMTQATPLAVFKQSGQAAPLQSLFWGTTNGSLGEISALLCIIGGLWLCVRRTASWEIPAGVILAAAAAGGVANLLDTGAQWTVLH